MKKRIVATLLVGALAVSSVIGLAACGGGSVSMPKGEEVTKEVWEKAFTSEQKETLKNYTASSSENAQLSVSGTYKIGDKEEEISITSNTNTYQTLLYDEETESSYDESTSSSNSKGTYEGEAQTVTQKTSEKSYTEKGEKDGEYWMASYSKDEYKDNDGTNSEENYWKAKKISYAPSNYYSSLISYYINSEDFSSTKEVTADTKVGTISELYDLFEYNGGVYTATLYSTYYLPVIRYLTVEYKISVSFKDGYLIGCSAKVDVSDTYEETTLGIKIDYSIKATEIYAITNIGTTDPSKKGTGDVAKAIEKAKEDYEKTESLLG